MIDSLTIAVHAFVRRVLISFSVDETLLPERQRGRERKRERRGERPLYLP